MITTKRNKTITAPTYTSISIIDRNSEFNNNHNIAEEKNEKTKLMADLTGLFKVTTAIELLNSNKENI